MMSEELSEVGHPDADSVGVEYLLAAATLVLMSLIV
jgi:hypothetical protein